MFEESLDLAHEAWERLVRLQEDDSRHDALAIDSAARLRALRERFLAAPPATPDLSEVGSRAHRDLALLLEARGAGMA